MAGDHFVFIFSNGTGRDGREQSLREDAEHQLVHLSIIRYLEGMSLEGSQLINRQLHGLYSTLIIQ
jgi:hypothetical protein